MKIKNIGLDRHPDQPTLRGLPAESKISASTGSREQVAGRSGRNGGRGQNITQKTKHSMNMSSVSCLYAWLGLFSFLPLVMVLCVSVLSQNASELVSMPLTTHAYVSLWSPLFFKVFYRSFFMAAFTCGACLLLAYPFSYLLIKSKHQSLLLLLIMIPFWTSSLVRTYALLSILKFNGLLNAFLLALHVIHHPITWLYGDFAVASGLIYTLFPFMVLPLFTHMEQFDFRLIEAAKDLGARRLMIFFRVFLPNTMQGIGAGCLLVFLPAMTLFYIPNILGGARSMLLGNLIQNQFLIAGNWPQGAATSTLLMLFFMVFLVVLRRKNRVFVVARCESS